MKNSTTYIFILFLLLLLLYGCSKKPEVDFNNIIAIVAGDTVFTSDLLTRAEYNVRPTYCDTKSDYDKRIILNSIIAEKLFALESVNTRSLVDNEIFNARIKGIKEQIMREELLFAEVNSKVVVPQDEIRQYYINSKKIVDAVAVFIPNSINANEVYKDAQNGMDFEQLSEKYIGISKPVEKKITWETVDEEAQLAIFSDKVTKGTIIEPVESEGGKRLIKVIGWTEEIELSPGTVNKQMELIKGKLHNRYVAEGTNKYVANIMKGKELKFDPKSWEAVSVFLKPFYVSSDENEEIEVKLSEIDIQLKNNADDPFIFDGDKRWTINDFRKAIMIHPLELNTKDITDKNFNFRLRSAIAALIIDDYLTKIAYSKNYDKLNVVTRSVESWKTYFNFNFQRDKILAERGYKGNIKKDYFDAFDNYLTPYFDSLKVKYDSTIRVNKEVLNGVELTSVQMFTRKSRGPYYNVTPPFPVATNSAKINYKLIETTKN